MKLKKCKYKCLPFCTVAQRQHAFSVVLLEITWHQVNLLCRIDIFGVPSLHSVITFISLKPSDVLTRGKGLEEDCPLAGLEEVDWGRTIHLRRHPGGPLTHKHTHTHTHTHTVIRHTWELRSVIAAFNRCSSAAFTTLRRQTCSSQHKPTQF